MRLHGVTSTLLAVLLGATAPPAEAQTPAQPGQPVFSGAGLRAKVVSIAVAKGDQVITMASILENMSDADVVVAMLVEPPRALDNKGNAFNGDINGIATCQISGRVTIDQCLEVGGRFGLPLERYTLLEKGKALTITFVFRRYGDRATMTQPLGDMLTFSAQITARAAGGDALGGSKSIGPPRMISIGIPLIPIAPAQ